MNGASADHEAIRSLVLAINDHWRAKQYDRIGALLANDVVVAPPGFNQRIRGRSAYVQSYEDYDQAAATLEFSAADPQIDVVGEVAVAVCPFYVVYQAGGQTHREKGHDILVLSRAHGKWTVVWRTMQAEPIADTPGSGRAT